MRRYTTTGFGRKGNIKGRQQQQPSPLAVAVGSIKEHSKKRLQYIDAYATGCANLRRRFREKLPQPVAKTVLIEPRFFLQTPGRLWDTRKRNVRPARNYHRQNPRKNNPRNRPEPPMEREPWRRENKNYAGKLPLHDGPR